MSSLSWAVVSASVALAACAGPNNGYTPMRADAMAFSEAHERCNLAAMSISGAVPSGPQLNAYNACMARNGWEDRRRLF